MGYKTDAQVFEPHRYVIAAYLRHSEAMLKEDTSIFVRYVCNICVYVWKQVFFW